MPGNFIKLAKDGEILVRGQSVMPGYYHLPEPPKVMPDSKWFLVTWAQSTARGQLTITGRKKELIVTAGGNVSPRSSGFPGHAPTHRPRHRGR